MFSNFNAKVKSLTKSFFLNPFVHILFRVFARNSVSITFVNMAVFVAIGIFHFEVTNGVNEVASMFAGWPFLVLAMASATVLFLRGMYDMQLTPAEIEAEARDRVTA